MYSSNNIYTYYNKNNIVNILLFYMENTTYYYLIMSQQALLNNEVIEEIVRERATYYQINKKPTDFWILISPNFIYESKMLEKIRKSNYYNKEKNQICSNNLNGHSSTDFEFFATLVSCDIEFIKWFKLRLGDFENIESLNQNISSFNSNGLYGEIKINSSKENSILASNNNYLHPSILINRYTKSLELYYVEQKNKLLTSNK